MQRRLCALQNDKVDFLALPLRLAGSRLNRTASRIGFEHVRVPIRFGSTERE